MPWAAAVLVLLIVGGGTEVITASASSPYVQVTGFSPGFSASGFAYNQKNGYLYLGDYNSPDVYVVSGTMVVANVVVPTMESFLFYDSSNALVYSCSGSNPPWLIGVINGTALVGNFTLPGTCEQPAFDTSNGLAYFPLQGGDEVAVVSSTSVVATIPVANPSMAVYDPRDGYVYVGNSESNMVAVISGTHVLSNVTVEAAPSYLYFDSANNFVYISSSTQNESYIQVLSGTSLVANLSIAGNGAGVAGINQHDGDVYAYDATANYFEVIQGTRTVGTVAEEGFTRLISDPSSNNVYFGNDTATIYAISGIQAAKSLFSISGTGSVGVFFVDRVNNYIYAASTTGNVTNAPGRGTVAPPSEIFAVPLAPVASGALSLPQLGLLVLAVGCASAVTFVATARVRGRRAASRRPTNP